MLTTPLTEDECHTLADNQGAPDTLAALRLRLAADPDSQTRINQWRHQRDALRRLHGEVLTHAVPPALLQAAKNAGAARDTASQRWHLGGIAAGVILAFGAGWLANATWQGTRALELDFVRQASLAHSVYVPEIRHPVEVTALEQAHLVQWLSKRLAKPLKVPDLTAQGFELVGGRLLPGDAGARAQFMYQNTAGSRVTLYLGALETPPAAGRTHKETGFRYEPHVAVPSFYWVDQGFGYALAGQLPQALLMALAQAVYQQL